MTEGRQALSVRLAGIEGGIECGAFTPLLSALVDGEASADDLARLRPHMKTCLSCRARLKEFRAAPARVAALVPPVALVAATASAASGPRWLWESVLGSAQQKAVALGERTHAAVELATGQKMAAVAASAAALAGGGTAVDQFARHEPPRASRRPPRPNRRRPTQPTNSPPPRPLPPPGQPQRPPGGPVHRKLRPR